MIPALITARAPIIALSSIVTRDVEENTVVAGSPAFLRYSKEEYDKKRKKWIDS